MDPTTAIPIHLTTESVVLAAAGLVLAWAVLRRNWIASLAAFSLVVVQSLHAGQFIEAEDDPWLLALRLIGVAGLAVSVLPTDGARTLFGAGLAAISGSAVWDAVAGGTVADVTIGPHLLRVAGAVGLLVWVWRATRPSVRLRVLAAFIAVLAVAFVVAGGAVARVAAVNSRDDQYARLAADAATVRRNVLEARDALRRRAVTFSPFLSTSVAAGSVEVDPLRLLPGEWFAVVDAAGAPLASVESTGAAMPWEPRQLETLEPFAVALKATSSSLINGTSTGLVTVAAAPIFRPGGQTVAADVIGVVFIGRERTVADLLAVAADPKADLQIVDGRSRVTTNPALAVAAGTVRRDVVTLQTLDSGEDRWLAAVAPLPDGDAFVVLASPGSLVVVAARDLVRAFLVAILAAALLAVVAALWLSTRITRPMLDLADEAERVKVDFLASVSHELRTPLTPIRGYTDLLRRGRIPAGDASGYLDEIGQAAARLERIVALLLDVASIEAGRFRVDAQEIASADLLREAEARWKGRSRRHRIDVHVPRDLPDVSGDREVLARVLDELIDNAIKFSSGGVVELGATQLDGSVEFTIRDEGEGMDVQRVEALRAAFTQADTGDTRRFGGLGLGLAFTEGVLRAHGSRLDITTALGEGTTCSFTLPVTGSVSPMSRAPARAGASTTSAERPERKKAPVQRPERKSPQARAASRKR
jgi:signal transduction histidine kinase